MDRLLPDRFTNQNRSAIQVGVAFGLAWVGGTAVSQFIINSISIIPVADMGGQIARLIVGILFAFFVAGIGAGIAGFVGGYALPVVHRERGRWGYGLRSALVIGILYGLLLYPVGFILSLFIFYGNSSEITLLRFAMLFSIMGVIYGALVGFFLALVTVGRHGLGLIVRSATVGFGFGGAFLGMGIRQYLLSINAANPGSEQRIWLLFGILFFGAFGGYTLGYVYNVLAKRPIDYPPDSQRRIWARRIVALAIVLFLLFGVFRPVLAGLADFLTPVTADLDEQLNSNTLGTHWSPAALVVDDEVDQLDIAASDNGRVALVYAKQNGVEYLAGQQDEMGTTIWQAPVQFASDHAGSEPQVAFDGRGAAHLVWADNDRIFYSQCIDADCTEPLALSENEALTCAGSSQTAPTIAINAADTIMVVWQTEGAPAFSSWVAIQSPETAVAGCVSGEASAYQPRVSGAPVGFALTYTTSEAAAADIRLLNYQGGWQAAKTVGNGRQPEIFATEDGRLHLAWCEDAGITYWSGEQREVVATFACLQRPGLVQDSNGLLHLLWHSDEVENNLGVLTQANVLLESVQRDGRWQAPFIAANTSPQNAFSVSNDSKGTLFQTRLDESQAVLYTTQVQYSCSDEELSPITQVMYDVARSELYRPPGTIVPYCDNQFDMLLYTPNPAPAFSEIPPTPNGAFDYNFDLVRQAQYEVLFSTMWYDADADDMNDSPGSLLAAAVADLYTQVRENPQNYPRGMTVRIMLGNPPEVAKGDLTNQLWNVLNDLRDAGVPEMINEEIGWRLEVADFGGSFPHSHTKSLIIDGKTAVAAGYNMSYAHFPVNHPSGKGAGRNDLGMQVTGPVAQDAQRMFDDLWSGSEMRHCRDFYPVFQVWQATCWDSEATADHVPEVLQYYLPGGETVAFSMHRTQAYSESDHQIEQVLEAAQESIDAIHVNFTAEMVCDLNLIYNEVCTFEQALPYLDNIVTAVAENGVQVRILVKSEPVDGVETSVALQLLRDELSERGLNDQVEIRFFNGPMHMKSTLIDDEFLIVGSQNFHYSAFGETIGLTEYNMGTSDPQAVADYKQLFEYHWHRAFTE